MDSTFYSGCRDDVSAPSGSPNNTLAAYSYNGVGRMVVEDFQQPDVRLDYWGQTIDTYAGFDRFGRITQQLWHDYGAAAGLLRSGLRVTSRHHTASSGIPAQTCAWRRIPRM